MSNDASLIADRQAPSVIRYSNLVPLSFKAKNKPTLFTTSNNSIYSMNSVIRIVFSSASCFDDGTNKFIKLDFKNTSAHSVRFANSAHSLFRHFRVLSSFGPDMENIRDYYQIHAAMSDLLLSPENRLVKKEQGYGHNTIPTPVAQADAAGAAYTIPEVLAEVNKLRSVITDGYEVTLNGIQINGSQCSNELTVGPGEKVTLCIPLDLSASIGMAAKKLVPLFLMGTLTLEIELNPLAVFNCDPFVAPNVANNVAGYNPALVAPTFEVSNVIMHSALVEFEGSVNMALSQMVANAGLFLHGCTWTCVQQILAPNQNNIICSEKLRSLKSLYIAFVPTSLNHSQRKTSRDNNNINSFQGRIGSEYLTNYAIAGDSTKSKENGEYIVELLKSASEYGNSMHTGLINSASFANNVSNVTTVGRALYGCECDVFGKENCESGISTVANTPISIDIKGNVVEQEVYIMMYHDILWTINNVGDIAVLRY